MGKKKRSWQDTASVLDLFSSDTTNARKDYHAFVKSGINQGHRQDLTGGGLSRSLGGWTEIRDHRTSVKGDQLILGENDFVMHFLSSAHEQYDRGTLLRNKGYTVDTVASHIATLCGLRKTDILSKGRQKATVEARSLFCFPTVRYINATITVDLARLIGMSPSAMSYAVTRDKKIAEDKELPFI
jgi:hypothetical protein